MTAFEQRAAETAEVAQLHDALPNAPFAQEVMAQVEALGDDAAAMAGLNGELHSMSSSSGDDDDEADDIVGNDDEDEYYGADGGHVPFDLDGVGAIDHEAGAPTCDRAAAAMQSQQQSRAALASLVSASVAQRESHARRHAEVEHDASLRLAELEAALDDARRAAAAGEEQLAAVEAIQRSRVPRQRGHDEDGGWCGRRRRRTRSGQRTRRRPDWRRRHHLLPPRMPPPPPPPPPRRRRRRRQ